jgi:hypothetical protein
MAFPFGDCETAIYVVPDFEPSPTKRAGERCRWAARCLRLAAVPGFPGFQIRQVRKDYICRRRLDAILTATTPTRTRAVDTKPISPVSNNKIPDGSGTVDVITESS